MIWVLLPFLLNGLVLTKAKIFLLFQLIISRLTSIFLNIHYELKSIHYLFLSFYFLVKILHTWVSYFHQVEDHTFHSVSLLSTSKSKFNVKVFRSCIFHPKQFTILWLVVGFNLFLLFTSLSSTSTIWLNLNLIHTSFCMCPKLFWFRR